MTHYEWLNRLGATLLHQADRDRCGALARTLRDRHKAQKASDPDDVLLELADELDTLASPILVVKA